jgi:hypothetical protein
MSSPKEAERAPPAGRAPQRSIWRTLPSSLFLVTAVAAYHSDSLAGRPWWTSSAITWLMLAVGTALGWWTSAMRPSRERLAFRSAEVVCAVIGLAWLLVRLRFVGSDPP